MNVYAFKPFVRFYRREGIKEADLCEAVKRAEMGLVDADLGGGLIKQRIARPGEGKSSGYRSLIVLRVRDRAVFVHGFAKNRKDNLSRTDLKALKELAKTLLDYDDSYLKEAIKSGALKKVICDDE
ncbi:MAG: type II toxin-antitoxin system RelE/ParE family toxin [Rhodospirillaceae bacterium]